MLGVAQTGYEWYTLLWRQAVVPAQRLSAGLSHTLSVVVPEPLNARGSLQFSPVLEIRMNTRLYVGNLPYSTKDADLQDLFSQVGGVVSASVITYSDTGRSKGFAFVEMSTSDEAQQAITRFNGFSLGGRPLSVSIARPREERPRFGGERNGGGWKGGRGDRR